MHGISKEVLKLVRASSALHAIADRSRRATGSFFDQFDRNDPEYDTEQVYFDLLREIGRSVELRVVVDIIAGASAGGINGTMLARALSHDLPMDALRGLWIENADVSVLLSPDARAGTWSKWFLTPFIWRVENRQVRLDRGHGGAPEAFAVRAFALVQAAARRADHGRSDVRRDRLEPQVAHRFHGQIVAERPRQHGADDAARRRAGDDVDDDAQFERCARSRAGARNRTARCRIRNRCGRRGRRTRRWSRCARSAIACSALEARTSLRISLLIPCM